jgi:hypothetical protein
MRRDVAQYFIAVSSVALCIAGCSTDTEVVARSTSSTATPTDGSLVLPPDSARCEPGSYTGSISTTPRDGGVPIQYSGTITFSLTESMSKEFVVLDDKSVLEGKGVDNSTFIADIVGGSECKEGTFDTTLTNGKYTLYTSADMSTFTMIDFDGTITGTYVAKYMGFIGEWSTTLHIGGSYPDIIVGGKWFASHSG